LKLFSKTMCVSSTHVSELRLENDFRTLIRTGARPARAANLMPSLPAPYSDLTRPFGSRADERRRSAPSQVLRSDEIWEPVYGLNQEVMCIGNGRLPGGVE
jgi:hypothetical protein